MILLNSETWGEENRNESWMESLSLNSTVSKMKNSLDVLNNWKKKKKNSLTFKTSQMPQSKRLSGILKAADVNKVLVTYRVIANNVIWYLCDGMPHTPECQNKSENAKMFS